MKSEKVFNDLSRLINAQVTLKITFFHTFVVALLKTEKEEKKKIGIRNSAMKLAILAGKCYLSRNSISKP